MNKNEQGITLIALTITIIVLMILTAVSLQALSKDGIVFEVKEETKNQAQRIKIEQDKMDDVEERTLNDWGM